MPVAKNTKHDVFKFINMHGGDPAPCWEWKRETKGGGRDNRPYFQYDGKKRLAYRIVYELVHGVELAPDQLILHQCDNQRCCNPHHHKLGDHQANMDEMVERERHGVNATVRRAIVKLVNGGFTHEQVAKQYGLSRRTIGYIIEKEKVNE